MMSPAPKIDKLRQEVCRFTYLYKLFISRKKDGSSLLTKKKAML